MKRANKFMLLFGVILAAVSFVAVLAFGSLNQQAPAPPPPDVPVVVASQNVALGTALTAEMLATVSKPPAEAVDTFQRPEELIGAVVRRAVTQGQAITDNDFQSGITVPQLVTSLQPGFRAVAVPLRKVDAVGALLQPGDWVDVILTMSDLDGLNPVVLNNPNGFVPNEDGEIPPPYVSLDEYVNNTSVKTVVQNVQVLAALPKSPTEPTNMMGGQATIEPDLIAILAVQPQQAEVIRFGQLDGHISLALRAPSDYAAGAISTSGITLQMLVEQYGVLPPLPVTP